MTSRDTKSPLQTGMLLAYPWPVCPYPLFHTAGATGSIPVPPTIQNKALARLPEDLLLGFGTVAHLESRRRRLLGGHINGSRTRTRYA